MENIIYTDGHFQIFGGARKLFRCFYSQKFFLKLSFIILARNGGKRDGGAKMTRGQEGQDDGGQDDGCHDVTCVTSHDPDHVTVIIRLILVSIRSDQWSMNVVPKQTAPSRAPVPGCRWSVDMVMSVCDNAIPDANAMSPVSPSLPSALQMSRVCLKHVS